MREQAVHVEAAPKQSANRILAALTPDDYDQVAPHLVRVALEARQVLFDVDRPIEHVYFPENCVVSIVGVMADGTAVETATVGSEGMVGLAVFHGTDRTSAQALCQVPGPAIRMPADVFRALLARSETLRTRMHRYALALLTLVGQTSACNRMHTMLQRCARWLLHTHDRRGREDGSNEFPLTQQFLAQMLGVRRATVTVAMGKLQSRGHIEYERGYIRVRDRAGLESAACECYAIIQREFERLLDYPSVPRAQPVNPLRGVQTSEAGLSTLREPDLDLEEKETGA